MVGASYALGGAALVVSGFLGVGAYLTAYAIETKWRGASLNWRDGYKEAMTAYILGAGTYGVFKGFGGIEALTTADKWKKTGYFMGLVAGIGIPAYRGIVYLREEVGVMNTLKGMYNGNIKQYLKDAWNHDIKKNWAKMAFKSVAIMTLPYHMILHYIPSDVMKVAAQKVLRVGSRLIQGGKYKIDKYAMA